jgi:hypothetical protein
VNYLFSLRIQTLFKTSGSDYIALLEIPYSKLPYVTTVETEALMKSKFNIMKL